MLFPQEGFSCMCFYSTPACWVTWFPVASQSPQRPGTFESPWLRRVQASGNGWRSNAVRACLCTHAQGFEMRGCREGMGLPVSGTLPSPAWSGARGEAQRLHRQPPMQARTISLLQAPPLAAFHLPNYQAEVAVWFALFLYVK